MTDIFSQCFALVIGHEGGFDTTAADPGNWTGGIIGVGKLRGTNWGISAGSYPNLDIANLTLAAAQTIYHTDYWARLQADCLPPALALLVFDAGVNNGVGQAIHWLQTAAGTPSDGELGPATLAAVAQSNVHSLCAEFQAQRLTAMASLPSWRVFGLGWARRLCQLPYQSFTLESSNA
jgi:lysozyme family protein